MNSDIVGCNFQFSKKKTYINIFFRSIFVFLIRVVVANPTLMYISLLKLWGHQDPLELQGDPTAP